MSYEIKEIVRKIKSKRESMGLSYKELEKKTGISASTLYRYETMETQIPIDKFQTICKVLGLEADKILASNRLPQYASSSDYIFTDNQEEGDNSPRFRWVARNAKKMTDEDLEKLEKLMRVAFEKIDFDEEG